MRKLLLISVLIFMLAACAPVTPQIESTPQGLLPNDDPVPAPTRTPAPVSPNALPAVLAARVALANALGVRYEDIEVAAYESVDWPDGCLGAGRPDEMCTEAIVPGYLVHLKIGPVQYEYRTNADGTDRRWVGQATVLTESKTPVLVWQNAKCDIFSVTTTQAAYGKCGDQTLTTPNFIVPENIAIVAAWENKYRSFEADTPAGKVTFTGQGDSIATASEQRMMAEWASLTNDVAVSERAGAAWDLAFSWSREGGIAGFCDNVSVYRHGLAITWSCGQDGVNYRLTASQLDRLYQLLDTYGTIDYEYKDPAVADAMTIRLTFAGDGKQKAADADIAAVTQFAAELAALGNFNRTLEPDIEIARAALAEYFAALNGGDYITAAKLYAGDTAQLEAWNPDIQNNLPKWLERGCTQNGLQCLQARTITYRGPDARGGHQFLVEFNHPDGTLFYQGETSSFIFAVVQDQVNGLWLVMDLPPYVP
jgi:hypothetical protein